jgi:flagellar basal-body rod protein FlgB
LIRLTGREKEMQPVQLFDLAAQQARWLAVRQSAIAGNIANANTPGYGAVDVEPFERVLDGTHVAMASTQPGHISGGATGDALAVRAQGDEPALMPSENTVVLEDEMLKAGEVRRSFELNTAIVKAFHRMILMTARP